MAINYNPTTVSDGLVLALDAANTRSYGGSGTTWTDITYRGNNGTLTNGPAYTTVGFNEPFGGAGGVYFDGTGDYLTNTYTTSAFDWYTTDVDFTIECWFYANSLSGTSYSGGPGIDHPTLIGNRAAASTTDYWSFGPTSDGKVAFYYYKGTETMVKSSTSITANSWNHISMTKTSLGITLFVNGLSQTASAIVGTPQSSNVEPLTIGQGNGTAFNGYISNLRVVKGTALYTSNFTPPRSLLPAVSGTSLLTCQKGSIRDASSNNFAITVNGDARPVYGFPSFKFDGTNDGVTIGSFPNTTFDFGSGEFTLECWVNISTFAANGVGTYGVNTIYGTGDSDVGSDFRFVIMQGSTLGGYTTNGVYLAVNSTPIAIGAYSSFATNTWYYVSASRIGNSLYLFLNGTLLSTTSYALSIPNATSYQPSIGVIQYRGSFIYPLNGRISNFRVLKGKGLTASEVLQNYNALKGRFGL
jgi:hypothetical protein